MASRHARLSIAVITAVAATSMSVGQSLTPDDNINIDALSKLRAVAPSVRAHTTERDAMATKRLFGTRMVTSRVSSDDAAERFITNHAGALGVPGAELEQVNRVQSATKNEIVYHYEQRFGGLPVENASARIVVKTGAENAVVYASGTLAPEPAGGFAQPEVTPDEAVQRVQLDIAYKNLPIWHDDQIVLVAYFDESRGETTLAWKFQGGTDVRAKNARAFTFFVDAFSAEILEARNAIYTADVPTNVSGFATPGNAADTPSNPPVLTPIEDLLLLNEDTTESAATDADGNALVPNNGGPSSPFITASLNNGIWVNINDDSGSVLIESALLSESMGGDLVFNQSPNEFTTAQVNTFIWTTRTHNFMNTYAPAFTGLDLALDANVNINDSCNAFFTNFGELSINFFTAGSGCRNTAFSSVVAHEYGHFILNQLGVSQGEFGEGYADSVSMLILDDPIIGRDFLTSGDPVRDPVAADLQFPCSGGVSVHFCGQVLGALWWEIRESLGLEPARELFGNWSLITGGPDGSQAAHPGTAIELLVADDDDGNIDNGTPNYDAICAALNNRNIDCPPLALISITAQQDDDGFIPANEQVQVAAEIEEITGQIEPGSAQLFTSVDGAPFTAQSLSLESGETFSGTLPPADCTSSVEYYFVVEDISGEVITAPDDAPSNVFSVTAAESVETPIQTSFEVDASGFTAGLPSDTAVTGQWERGDPIGTAAQPENAYDGEICFFTGQGSPGGGLGDNDVDEGITTLLSPEIDLNDFEAARMSYFRWYSNDTGANPNADTLRVDIRTPGGSWTNVETVGPGGEEASGGWFNHQFDVGDFVSLPATVQIRVVAEDQVGNGSLVEAAFDALTVTGVSCVAVEPCVADCDGSGVVDFNDLTSMLFEFGAQADASCDADGSGTVDFNDLTSALFLFGPCEG